MACAGREVVSVAPWNGPILSLRSITAPIALGNTIACRRSGHRCRAAPREVFGEAGLPPGVLSRIDPRQGGGRRRQRAVEHPAVRRLNFTGSTATGRKLAEAAGRHLKRVVLELGGYNPLLVLADADLDYAVDAAAFGAFLHQGQICMSARRIIVERPIANAFLGRLVTKVSRLKVGDPKQPDTIIGPLINEQAMANVKSRVEDAVARGASVLVGGKAEGRCFQPTLLANVPAAAIFAREETFGPVAAVDVVEDAEEAVRRANATSYGLAAGILTGDSERDWPWPASPERDRARQRPAGPRRAADAVRGREGQRLGPLRRPRRPRGVHRAARITSRAAAVRSLSEAGILGAAPAGPPPPLAAVRWALYDGRLNDRSNRKASRDSGPGGRWRERASG